MVISMKVKVKIQVFFLFVQVKCKYETRVHTSDIMIILSAVKTGHH